jgi:membrane fusion protein (multidrug efflux system)
MEEQKQKSKRKPLIILTVVLLLMAGGGAGYWVHSSHYESTDDAQIDGNIYSVRAGVTAYLDRICFKDHQRVEKGDTLFVFDTVALKAKVKQAKAALAKAKTKLSMSDIQALASRQNAKASYQSALSGEEAIKAAHSHLKNARKDFNRDKKLRKINAVTQVQYDADQTALEQAKADYQRAVHKHHSATISSAGLNSKAKAAHHAISSAAALVEQRKAELRLAKNNLRHAFVTAPSSGIVTKRSVDEGQYVLAGQSLCAVVDEQHLWVTANFKETKLHKIEPGQPVQISVDAYPDLILKGVVQSNGGATGAKFSLIPPDNATGNFIKVTQRVPLRIHIDPSSIPSNKPNGRDISLEPGLSTVVKINTK